MKNFKTISAIILLLTMGVTIASGGIKRMSEDSIRFGTGTIRDLIFDYNGDPSSAKISVDSTNNEFLFNRKVNLNEVEATGTVVVNGDVSVLSTTKGSTPCPVMTEAQRDAIVGPLEGQCVYDNTNKTYSIYDGTDWIGVGGGLDKWATAKNYKTDNVVWNPSDNKIYRALSDFTSGGTFNPVNWDELSVYPLEGMADKSAQNNLQVTDSEGVSIYREESDYWYIEDFKEVAPTSFTVTGNLDELDKLSNALQGRQSGLLTQTALTSLGDKLTSTVLNVPVYARGKANKISFDNLRAGNANWQLQLEEFVGASWQDIGSPRRITSNNFKYVFNINENATQIRYSFVVETLEVGSSLEYDRIRITDNAFETGETVITHSVVADGYISKDGGNRYRFRNISNSDGGVLTVDNTTYTKYTFLKKADFSVSTNLNGNAAFTSQISWYDKDDNLKNLAYGYSAANGTVSSNINGESEVGDYLLVAGSFTPNDSNSNTFSITAQAKTDNVVIEGDTLPSLTETKILSADVTTNTTVSDLTFTDLEVGVKYFVSGVIYTQINLGGANAPNLYVTHTNGSTVVSRTDSRASASNEQVISHGVSYSFVASDSTLTFNTSNASSNSKVVGSNNRQRTFIQLTKERTNAIVQIPQNKISPTVTKFLQASTSSNTTDVPDLRLTDLEIGERYRLFVKMSASRSASGVDNVNITANHNGSPIAVIGTSLTTSGQNASTSESVEFIASASTVTFDFSSIGTGSTIGGSGNFSNTYVQLTKLPTGAFIGEASPERYSTAEIDTGKVWIDGKPIYRRTWSSDSSYSTTAIIETLPTGFKVIDMYGTFKNLVNQWLPINLDTSSASITFDYNENTGDLTRYHNAYSIAGYRLVMEYTK